MPEEKINENFDNLWEEACSKDDFTKDIAQHKREHLLFIGLVCKYIDLLLKKKESLKILEIGCGSAIDSYLIAERYDSRISFTGTDLSRHSIELAEKVGKHFKKQVAFAVDDATDSNFPDESFDLIFSQGVIEHFKNPAAIMIEQIRLLKKDGFLIVDVPQKYHFLTIYKHLLMMVGKWRFGWETEYSSSELKNLGISFGLIPIEMAGFGYFYRKDPLFHIRRLHRYFQKINLFRKAAFFRKLEDKYEKWYTNIEQKHGHRFLLHVTGVFKKPNTNLPKEHDE